MRCEVPAPSRLLCGVQDRPGQTALLSWAVWGPRGASCVLRGTAVVGELLASERPPPASLLACATLGAPRLRRVSGCFEAPLLCGARPPSPRGHSGGLLREGLQGRTWGPAPPGFGGGAASGGWTELWAVQARQRCSAPSWSRCWNGVAGKHFFFKYFCERHSCFSLVFY